MRSSAWPTPLDGRAGRLPSRRTTRWCYGPGGGLWYGPPNMRLAAWSLKMAVALVLLVSVGCMPSAASLTAPGMRQAPRLEGKLLYVRDGDVWVWRAGEAQRLTSGGTWRQPALSPGGSEIVYVYREQNFSDLFAMAADGTSSRHLFRGQAAVVGDNDWSFRPTWSRDGSQIAYITDTKTPKPVVWVMNKDGSNKRQVMEPGNADLEAADAMSWAPDGQRLAVTAMGSRGPTQVYILELGRDVIEPLSEHALGAFDPAWSPNGELIAYIARDGGRGELRIKRLDEAGEARFDKLLYVRSPVWSPDGQTLAVLSAQSGSFEVWTASIGSDGDVIQIGDFRQLTHDGGIDAASGLSWSR